MAEKVRKIGAIDVGSNAIRLMIGQVDRKGNEVEILCKKRVSLRLGTEAFSKKGEFSEETIQKAAQVFKEFSEKFKRQGVSDYAAFATSAFRDAKNSTDLAKSILKQSGIRVKKMSGDMEAQIILSSVLSQMKLDKKKDYLLFDLGGGSLELSQIEQGRISGSKSFDLGTVRLMNLIKDPHFSEEKVATLIKKTQSEILKFVDSEIVHSKALNIIGTGGNFRRLLKTRNQIFGEGKLFVRPDEVSLIEAELSALSYKERIKVFSLREDRADVILPAIQIMSAVFDILPVQKIYTPNVGLVNGILQSLANTKN